MDKLYEAARYYKEKLNGRSYLLIAVKSGKILSLEIIFNENAFKHLSGIHKATDLKISKQGSEKIYQQILDKKTTIQDINKSEKFIEIEKRLDDFNKVGDLLSSPEDMRKSLYGTFGYGRGISADYLLSQMDEEKYIHLFLKEQGDVVLPVTFFTNQTDYYLKNNTTRWSIIDVEELLEKDDKKRKVEIAKLRARLSVKTGKSIEELKEEIDMFYGKKNNQNNKINNNDGHGV